MSNLIDTTRSRRAQRLQLYRLQREHLAAYQPQTAKTSTRKRPATERKASRVVTTRVAHNPVMPRDPMTDRGHRLITAGIVKLPPATLTDPV